MCNVEEDAEIFMQGEKLKRVDAFKYLGSTVQGNGSLNQEINHRIQAGWNNWKKVSGVLCDKRISIKTKGKIYKTCVRPAAMYGSETWPLKKAEENKLNSNEMRMLRWMSGVTKRDMIRNERIRGTTKVTEISKKIQERRLVWYGHVMRREEQYIGKRVMSMNVDGRRRRERPCLRWTDCIRSDLRGKGLSEEEAQNRGQWKRSVRNADPT